MKVRSASIPLSGRICTNQSPSLHPSRSWRRGRVYSFGKKRVSRHACAASSEQSFASGSDLLGPTFESAAKTTETTTESIAEAIAAVELKSERSLDFTRLKELLSQGDFKTADDESRGLLLQLSGEDAQSRGWIYFTEVSCIPATDLKTIDDLWKASSQGKFGYSVQKKIFAKSMRRWSKFFKAIDWTVGENNNYRKWPTEFIYSLEAKPGHLPLTNCLRGTQLFEGLMHHSAFETEEKPESDAATKWTAF